MIDAEKEQELRDALLRAMQKRDQPEANIVMAQMELNGIDAEVVAANTLLDLDQEALEWWLEPRPGPVPFISIEEVVTAINEAARREAGCS